jgi:hypothetical protein
MFVMTGREPRLPLDQILEHRPAPNVDEPTRLQVIAETMAHGHKNVQHTVEQDRAKMIAQYRRQFNVKEIKLKLGDKILVKEERELIGRQKSKLYPHKYTGPFIVVQLGSPTVEVTRMDGSDRHTVHLSTATLCKHDMQPKYGTKRAPRQLVRPQPTTRRPPDRSRYDMRHRPTESRT